MKLRKWHLFAAIAMAIAFLLWKYGGSHIRYRLTVYAELNGAAYSGEGVVECSYSYKPQIFAGLPGSPYTGVMNGHAIAVDLGEGGKLFVINYLS